MLSSAAGNGHDGRARQAGVTQRHDHRMDRPQPSRKPTQGNAALLVFPVSVLLAFLVLAALYESWVLPLAVILIVSDVHALGTGWRESSMAATTTTFVQVGLVVLMGPRLQERDPDRRVLRANSNPKARASSRPRLEACRLRFAAHRDDFSGLHRRHESRWCSRTAPVPRCASATGVTVFAGMIGVTPVRPVPDAGVLCRPAQAWSGRKLIRPRRGRSVARVKPKSAWAGGRQLLAHLCRLARCTKSSAIWGTPDAPANVYREGQPLNPLRSSTAQRSIVGNVGLLFPQGGAYLTVQKHEMPGHEPGNSVWARGPAEMLADQCARGSGRNLELDHLGQGSLASFPCGMASGSRWWSTDRGPFQPAFGSSMRPSIHLA